MNRKSFAVVAIAVSLGLFVPAALGQGTDLATVRGVVTDSSGSVVLNAAVSVTDTSTGAVRQTKTNGAGEYQIFGLRSGTYKVVVTSTGFAVQEVDNVQVQGSQVVGVNLTLRVSTAEEKIDVSVDALQIDTENATISDSIESNSVIDLPRNTRDIYNFLYLNPNITQADSSEDGMFKFIGSQSYGASFSLDGQRSNGGIFGTPTNSEPSLEAIDEVNILSSNFSAEYPGIANIRITTKRGSNQYHGSMFYNNKNSALAAWTLQDQMGKANFAPAPLAPKYPNPAFNENDLGASFSGPIPKLKNTWFFLAYERDYNVSPVYIQSSKFPHPSLYTGNFSLLPDASRPDVDSTLASLMTPAEMAADTTQYTDPSSGETFQVLNQIPSRLLNPSVQTLINNYFPHVGLSAPIDSNGRIPEYQSSVPGRNTLDLGTLRLDHDFSQNDHAYVAYNASANDFASNTVSSSHYPGLGLTQNTRQNHTVSVSYTHVFNQNLVNEARGGFNKQNLFRHSNTTLESFLSGIGFDSSDIAAYGAVTGNSALSTFGQTAINFTGAYSTFDNGGRNTDRPMSQALTTFGDTLSWVKGGHNLKFGGDAVRNWAVDGFAWNRGNPRGSMTYGFPGSCLDTGANNGGDCLDNNPDPFVDFLLGASPTSASTVRQFRPAMDVHNWEQGYFAQDDWKVTPHLTVNLGLRWDLFLPFVDKNDIMVNFDPNLTNPVSGQPGVFVIPSTNTLQYLDPRILSFGYLTASQTHQGIGRGLIKPDYHDFAPRLGVAWAIGDKSVLRAGYGMFYPTSAAQGIRDSISTNPFNQGATWRKTLEPWPGFQGEQGVCPICGGTLRALGQFVTANAVPADLRDAQIHQYNVTFERQVGFDSVVRLSYLGTHMAGLIAGRDLNEIAPNNVPFGTTQGDGVTPCDPTQGNCDYSPADLARYRFPIVGENLLTYGNFAYGNSNALQAQIVRRPKKGLFLNISYTYLDQKSTIGDTANSSLGSVPYNPFTPSADYSTDGFVSHHRLVAYGTYDLPVGRGRAYGSGMSKWVDAVVGGWQTTFNMFAKSGTGYTPFWVCDDCDPVFPGNVAAGSMDATGDFGFPNFRPNIVNGNYYTGHGGSGAIIWNSSAFTFPSVGSDFFSNPAVAKRNILMGPSTWGVNLGIHKTFEVSERVKASLGADVDNLLNHPLLAPDLGDSGGGCGSGCFANLGDFNVLVNQTPPPAGQQPALLPITSSQITFLNPDFGHLIKSYNQEGVTARREIRLRLRITF